MTAAQSAPLQVAIVGSGPSGFYAAEALLRRRPDVKSWRELLEQARDSYEQDVDDVDDLVAS